MEFIWLFSFMGIPLALVAGVHVVRHALYEIVGRHTACGGLIVLTEFRPEKGEEERRGRAGEMGQRTGRGGISWA